MADGTPFEDKLYEVLIADAPLVALLATDANSEAAIYLAKTSPVGVRYPSLSFEWREGMSTEQLPTSAGVLTFYITMANDAASPYETWKSIKARILTIFNRNPAQPLTDIDVSQNEGLRVVKILKSSATYRFSEQPDKFVCMIVMDCIKSEDEDFSTSYGNGSWN